MAPTYLRRRPGSQSIGFLGSALFMSSISHSSPVGGIDEAKAALRAQALAKRRALPADLRAAFARRLALEGVTLAKRLEAQVVSVFLPIGDEPDTLALLSALRDAGVTTALPVTVGRRSPLIFRRWSPGEPTQAGPMKISEPLSSADTVAPDLLFTPLSVFDRLGNRIGYGMGHYDRSLATLRANGRAIAVGVAYSASEAPNVPAGAHDQRLDFVLTERELIETRAL